MPERALQTPDGEDFDVRRFINRRKALRDEFSQGYKDTYRQIADIFRPRRGYYLRDGDDKHHGRRVDQYVVNSTTLRVSNNAQSGLQAGVTSPSRPWKKLGPPEKELIEIPGAREFYDELDQRVDFVLGRSNFYRSTQTSYADFVDMGPAALQIDEHPESVIRCQVHPVGSWVGTTDPEGRVDVFYRDYRPTGYELRKKFGDEALTTELVDQIKRNPYKRRDLMNAIEPNPFYRGRNQPAIGIAAFPYVSVWWVKGFESKFVKMHGYHEFPVMVYRFTKSENNDAYGFGAGDKALGDGKQLQHMERKKLRAIDKGVEPALQAPTSLQQVGVSMVPNKITYHDGPGKVESLYALDLDLGAVREDIAQVERRLSQAFFEDLFLMITQDVERQTTAREIQERHEEKLVMLGPVLESLNEEFLDPGIKRVLGIMRRAQLWPEAPPELANTEIKVEYISILAQAQRAVRTVSIEQGVNFASAFAQSTGKVEILDRLNPDGTWDEYSTGIGFPAKASFSAREAEGARQQRAEQAAQDQQLERAAAAASAGKDAAAALAPPGPQTSAIEPSVLAQFLSAGGQ